MSPRTIALALGLSSLAIASVARAEAPAAGASRFAFLDAPPPEPAPRAPAPAGEADEYARKSWEAFPLAGFAAPFCRGPSLGLGDCGDSGHGTVLGGGALYRISPYVALGATVSFASFQLDGPPSAGAYSRASFMGLLVRGYFSDRGAVDPYVETGFGRGTASTGMSDGTIDVRSDASGPAATVGAGIDFWVLPVLKLGPAISYRWTFLGDVRTCTGAACETVSVSDWGAVGSFASVSLVATLALGHEM
jgi:hypothetical protein